MRNSVLFFLFLFTLKVWSQRIINFNLFPIKNSVTVKFTITPGSSCNGYTIYHSLDSLNFIPIYDYPAICGASGANEEVTFTHQTPAVFQNNYYKVQLFPVEVTPIKKIFLSDAAQSGMMAIPNPVHDGVYELKLKIFNASNTKLYGFLYNPFGNVMGELNFTTLADMATINISNLKNGLYIVWLTDGLAPYSCKFIIKR